MLVKQTQFGKNIPRFEEMELYLQNFNISEDIILACTKRNVPKENYYWYDQTSFLDFKVRYLSIPFWIEICHRINLAPLSFLLSEVNLKIMELILHYSELEERKIISFHDCINKCLEISAINESIQLIDQVAFFKLLNNYPNYVSLRRGNFLLFYNLLFIKNDSEKLILTSKLLIDLIICGCIIDDLHDYKEDKANNELNIVIELEQKGNSLNELKSIYDSSKQNISNIFPELNKYLNETFAISFFKLLEQIT